MNPAAEMGHECSCLQRNCIIWKKSSIYCFIRILNDKNENVFKWYFFHIHHFPILKYASCKETGEFYDLFSDHL